MTLHVQVQDVMKKGPQQMMAEMVRRWAGHTQPVCSSRYPQEDSAPAPARMLCVV
jgi:hypothetical protein